LESIWTLTVIYCMQCHYIRLEYVASAKQMIGLFVETFFSEPFLVCECVYVVQVFPTL